MATAASFLARRDFMVSNGFPALLSDVLYVSVFSNGGLEIFGGRSHGERDVTTRLLRMEHFLKENVSQFANGEQKFLDLDMSKNTLTDRDLVNGYVRSVALGTPPLFRIGTLRLSKNLFAMASDEARTAMCGLMSGDVIRDFVVDIDRGTWSSRNFSHRQSLMKQILAAGLVGKYIFVCEETLGANGTDVVVRRENDDVDVNLTRLEVSNAWRPVFATQMTLAETATFNNVVDASCVAHRRFQKNYGYRLYDRDLL